MTTFQAIIYSLVHGFSEFLPIGRSAHEMIIPYLFGWAGPTGSFTGALSLGALLSILVYFRHDWASIISCFLQVIIFRKRPMTLDERLPLFLTITSLPIAAAYYYFHGAVAETDWNLPAIAISTAAFGLPLLFAESSSRKNKGMFDWNWLDALVAGLTQAAAIIPGCGLMTGILTGALFRNYNHEAAAKYALFAITPVIAVNTFMRLQGLSFHDPVPAEGMTWLTFNTSIVVTFFAGLLAIGGFMRQIQRKSFKQYVFYRWILAAAVMTVYWFRSRR